MSSRDSNVTDQIMKYINEQISIGKWPIGSKIPSENELCQRMGYSRTSIRSAIQRYNELGILESVRGSGTYVRSLVPTLLNGRWETELFEETTKEISVESFRRWREARSVIEPHIVYKVAKEATPELIEKLKQINREQFEARGNQQLFIDKDIEFHMTIVSFLDNEFLTGIVRQLLSMREMQVFSNEKFGYFGGGYFHMQIAEAIEKHDAERARDLMQEHQAEFVF